MKKCMAWLFVAAVIIFVIDWLYLGLKIALHEYDITVFAYIGLACILVMAACIIYRTFSRKCRHCGRLLTSGGSYCPHCGGKQ